MVKNEPSEEGSWIGGGWGRLLVCSYGNWYRLFFYTVFEAFKNGTGVIRGLAQGIENAVAHFQRSLECGFLAAVLAVREVFGELIPLAADAQSPSLERGCLIGVAGDIALCHCCWVLVWVIV